MEAKYNLSVDENIFVAKRNIIDYIWKSAKLEGLAVTFPETEAILPYPTFYISISAA